MSLGEKTKQKKHMAAPWKTIQNMMTVAMDYGSVTPWVVHLKRRRPVYRLYPTNHQCGNVTTVLRDLSQKTRRRLTDRLCLLGSPSIFLTLRNSECW